MSGIPPRRQMVYALGLYLSTAAPRSSRHAVCFSVGERYWRGRSHSRLNPRMAAGFFVASSLYALRCSDSPGVCHLRFILKFRVYGSGFTYSVGCPACVRNTTPHQGCGMVVYAGGLSMHVLEKCLGMCCQGELLFSHHPRQRCRRCPPKLTPFRV